MPTSGGEKGDSNEEEGNGGAVRRARRIRPPIGEQSDRDSKKLVEIALLASASTFAFCSGIAEGSVSMPSGDMGVQERYHALARVLQLAFDMYEKDTK